jgi:hypothetical protein
MPRFPPNCPVACALPCCWCFCCWVPSTPRRPSSQGWLPLYSFLPGRPMRGFMCRSAREPRSRSISPALRSRRSSRLYPAHGQKAHFGLRVAGGAASHHLAADAHEKGRHRLHRGDLAAQRLRRHPCGCDHGEADQPRRGQKPHRRRFEGVQFLARPAGERGNLPLRPALAAHLRR